MRFAVKDREIEKDILAKALEELKDRAASSSPPDEVVRGTLVRLSGAEPGLVTAAGTNQIRIWLWPAAKLAVAASILIAVGYTAGRVSAQKPLDLRQLRTELAASLEPEIRKNVLEEVARDRQQALLAAYIQIKNDLTEQYRADLNRFAIQTFTASNTVTNRLLEELVQYVKDGRLQDRQLVADAMAEDHVRLGSALVGLAATTETKLQRAEDMVKLLVYQEPDTPVPTNNKIRNRTQGE
jgi:hypothetical protein